MWFSVITLFPDMFNALTQSGIVGRAVTRGQAVIHCVNPRDFAEGQYRRVDERPFGGGPGMVMMAPPLAKAITFAQQQAVDAGLTHVPVIYLSPQGERFSEVLIDRVMRATSTVLEASDQEATSTTPTLAFILLCGRYEGVDERLIERYVTEEWSIGDYVLTGGELPAMVVMDSLIRRIPHVMQDNASAEQDSFVDGLLDCPHYTKPDVFEELAVPAVLKSGHHAEIEKWRFLQRYARTQLRRPDLIAKVTALNALTKQQQKWLKTTFHK